MLKVHQASYHIEGKTILQNVSIDANAGEILGVLGPNGAGKTSLLKMVSGQIASRQMIHWQNKAIEDYSATERARQVAVVNQFNNSVFALNLEQIVNMGLLPHQNLLSKMTEKDKQDIRNAIELVELTNKSLQGFHTLSGGEQQRGLIARALVQKAQLLVLDEPINHLDIYYQHQILQLLKHLASNHNLCIVMSLHELNLAATYCDRLCLLSQGSVEKFGQPSQVLKRDSIESVFKTPCEVTTDKHTGKPRIDFYPHTVRLDEMEPKP